VAAGMDSYLSKPIRPQELDDALDALLASKRALSAESDHTSTSNHAVEVIQLLDRIDDDRALLAELVEIFRREYPENLRTAQQAILAKNSGDLQGAAHTLRGALGNLSATYASTLAAELETAGAVGDFVAAQATLDKLIPQLDHVTRALEALCPVPVR